jgi:hypothetical protein
MSSYGYQTAPSPNTSNTNFTAPGVNQYMDQAKKSGEEARKLTEQSKTSALGYYGDMQGVAKNVLQAQQGYYKPLQDMLNVNPDLISPEQQQAMMANRRASLAAYGQNIAGQLGDSDSGIAQGQRGEIMRNIACLAFSLFLGCGNCGKFHISNSEIGDTGKIEKCKSQ